MPAENLDLCPVRPRLQTAEHGAYLPYDLRIVEIDCAARASIDGHQGQASNRTLASSSPDSSTAPRLSRRWRCYCCRRKPRSGDCRTERLMESGH